MSVASLAAFAAGSVASAPREILVMLRSPPAHARVDGSYGAAGQGDAVRAQSQARVGACLAAAHGLTVVTLWAMPALGMDCVVLALLPAAGVAASIAALQAHWEVAWARPMNEFHAQGHLDPLYASQPAAAQQHLDGLRAEATGRHVHVAIIDSGVDDAHSDLAQVVQTRENFVDGQAWVAEFHGTAVAGLVAARADNGIGIVGIAPDAQLYAPRACRRLTTPARSSAMAGAWRQAGSWALGLAVLALPCASHAQFAGTPGLDNVDRYRGTDAVGPVLHASVMADAAAGAYGGASGLWRTRDAGLASADAMVGWSGRFAELAPPATLSPDRGWDVAVHRAHYGSGSRSDFSEAMLGLLATGWTLRTWYAPHYFGGHAHTCYSELDKKHAFDAHWRAFGRAGWLHYGSTSTYQARLPDRVDAPACIGYTVDRWDFRVAHGSIVAGQARADFDARRRRAARIRGASVAF